ncbi:pectin lyase fold/virulence factor [Desarmillaria tabescens]|uniref:galacturonan 1,4-alpha-galacturonidase n=1 Tax=Armillaria tabescens TaxID=1929756 RepID=A0AA39NCF5_ARMTA|nr:pectin lyase fold/virulence factor [Desarmillaria tabescens]KAK0463055.1 pectin lyase fold/virulence factor [Desarmillaria tabescens]
MFVFAGVVAALIISSSRAAECTVERSDNGMDDSAFILKAFADCAEDSVITFTEANYSAYTPMSFTDLRNVTVHLNGNLNLPNNISQVQQAINTTNNPPSTYATPWFYFSGSDVQLIGSESDEWGRFNGFGQQWWDIGNRTLRPQLATFNVTNGLLRGLKVIKPVAWGWNLPGQNIRVENHFVDAKPDNGTRDDTTSFPFNTDGINVSGQNITIDGYYGHNGDDCVSVVNGARDVLAQNGFCGFSSHGLSIGSLGKNGAVQTVENVVFRNWTMEGAVYGARFKSWTGGRGYATNVTWEDIALQGVSTGILITQNYYDQDKGARPENTNQTSTQISNFTYKNFTGTLAKNWTDGTCISDPCWNYVEGGDATQAIIFDLFPDTALNLSFSGINVTPNDTSKETTVICDPATLAEGEQDTLGFNCTDGPLVTTTIEPADDSTMGAGGVSMTGVLLVGVVLLLGV